MRRLKPKLRSALRFPDHHNAWIPSAVRVGLQAIADERVDVILSTSPPVSCHLVADVLAALGKHDVALIEADSPDELGGLLYVEDHREIPMCFMWCRKG